jgi:hypothetical protein
LAEDPPHPARASATSKRTGSRTRESLVTLFGGVAGSGAAQP